MEIKRCNSPVTVQSEQATAYAAAEGNNKDLLETVKMVEEKGCLVSSQGGLQDKSEKIEVAGTAVQKSDSYAVDAEACKDAVQKIKEVAPEQILEVMPGLLTILDFNGIINVGKIKIGRLVMNRWPKQKSVNSMALSIMADGIQVMLLVIPGTVAVMMGYDVEDFDGNPIPEEQLVQTVIIVDGQTRYMAIRKIMNEHLGKTPANVFAYFPTNWINLTKMLQTINLKVFTWKNSDFICGLERAGNINDKTARALSFVRQLERQGYNFTAACEWMTMVKGIIRKPSLVKAMNATDSKLCYDNSEYGIKIHETAKSKFTGNNEKALKNKTVPEFIIDKWNNACNELNKKEATSYIIAYLNGLADKDIAEIVSPSGYKRGNGKPKADFIKAQLEDSFQRFNKTNPFATFKANTEQGE